MKMLVRSRTARRCRLAEGKHQPVRPIEEGRAVDHVDDLGIVEADAAQLLDMLFAECDRRRGQCNRSPDNGIPARAEISANALVEQPLNIVAALGMDGGKTR